MEVTIPPYIKNKAALKRKTKDMIARDMEVSPRTLYNYLQSIQLKTRQGLVSIEEQIVIYNHFGWPSHYL